ncbi:MAG: hypothetical protein KF878_27755 [Planctomycetes bacterium]|nr:hypothetical protein [Planctomycetota bacterium]
MSPLVALTLGLLAQVSSPELVTVLEALERQEEVAVAPGVGGMAVEVLRARPDMPAHDLELHLEVAVRGRAFEPLVPLLHRWLAEDGPAFVPALRAAGQLDARARDRLVTALGPAKATRSLLLEACLGEDEPLARGGIALVAQAGSAQPGPLQNILADLVRGEYAARATFALEVVAAAPASEGLFTALLETAPSVPEGLHQAWGMALAAQLDQRPALARAAVERLEREPSVPLLRAMVAAPPDCWDDAIGHVIRLIQGLSSALGQLDPSEVEQLVAAIRAAGELRAPELLPIVPELCRPSAPLPVRLAALEALGDVGARDAWVIDLLLAYITEPRPVGSTAYTSLLRRAGVRLPHRPLIWQDWRSKTVLPELDPVEHAARLLADRENRYAHRQATRAPRD